MTFGGLKENNEADNFENSALTEDSLRLALAKLGSKSDRKRPSSSKSGNPFASGNSRSANTPTRRKFAREDSVVVEKLSPRLSNSVSRVVGAVERVRSPYEEKAASSSSDHLQSLKQDVAFLKQAQKNAEEQQKIVENRLAEIENLLEKQGQALTKLKELVTFLHAPSEETEKPILEKEEIENFAPVQERHSNDPIPVKLKEDADPIEWWKN
ncbi:hypothetical protein FAI41_07665 [Acetobacteraceae bacterium]|nr:hypothetical protein FAI41_07665 [Acetobacteraceae bacterium]